MAKIRDLAVGTFPIVGPYDIRLAGNLPDIMPQCSVHRARRIRGEGKGRQVRTYEDPGSLTLCGGVDECLDSGK